MPTTPGKWDYSFTFTDSLGGSSIQNVTAYVGTKLDISRAGYCRMQLMLQPEVSTLTLQ